MEKEKKYFTGALKFSWFAFRRGRESDVKLLDREGELCERSGVSFKSLGSALMIAGGSAC